MLLARFMRLRGRPTLPRPASCFHSSAICWGKVLRTFKLADIGEGITECEVIRWYVAYPESWTVFLTCSVGA